MAFLQCNFYSQVLHSNVVIGVILPSPESSEVLSHGDSGYFQPGILYQTLYLFHGAYGDYSDWMRFTSIERYAQKHKIAVVMPSVQTAFIRTCILANVI